MTHGLYSQKPPAIDAQDLPEALARTFDGETAATRAMLRRAIGFYPKDLGEAVRALDLFGRATMRLKRLILLERQLKTNLQETEFEQALEQALKELGWGEEQG